ncbi:MAG: hypothetical protein V3S12_00010 [Acidiferrobacterales bacterium]
MKIWNWITTRGPVGFVRNWFYITGHYQGDLQMLANGVDQCLQRANTVEHYVKKATKVHVSVPADLKNATKVIVIGTYRGKDHVQVFYLRPGSMDMLINQLKDMERYADINVIEETVEATMNRQIIV